MKCYVSVGMVIHADEKLQKIILTKELISKVKDKLHPKPFVEGKIWKNGFFPNITILNGEPKEHRACFGGKHSQNYMSIGKKSCCLWWAISAQPLILNNFFATMVYSFVCLGISFQVLLIDQLKNMRVTSTKLLCGLICPIVTNSKISVRDLISFLTWGDEFELLVRFCLQIVEIIFSFIPMTGKATDPDVPKKSRRRWFVWGRFWRLRKDISADVSLWRELDHRVRSLWVDKEEIALVEIRRRTAVGSEEPSAKPSSGGGRSEDVGVGG